MFYVFCAAKQTNLVTNNLSQFWVIDLGLKGLCPITSPLSYAVPRDENCIFPSRLLIWAEKAGQRNDVTFMSVFMYQSKAVRSNFRLFLTQVMAQGLQ